MKKRISSIVLTVVMILGCFITDMNVNINTVNADPYNIEISVETKEISIEEIPKNRRVPLDIWISNVPDDDIYFFDIVYKLDDKIGNYSTYCKYLNSFLITSITDVDTGIVFVRSDTVYNDDKKIPNGRFYTLSVYIPPEVSEGLFYEVTPIPEYADSNRTFYTSFALESNREEVFKSPYLTFHGGGIKIKSSQPEQPVQPEPTPNDSIIYSDQPNSNPVTQPQIVTETSTFTEDTTCLVSSVSTTSVSSPTKETTYSDITTKNTVSETSTEITTTNDSNKENNRTNLFILLFFIVLLIFIVILTILIRKKN